MRTFSLFLGAAAITTASALVLLYGPAVVAGQHTAYCPLSHKIRDTSACAVLDTEGDRTLVLHADTVSGERYLELIVGKRSRRYRLPAGVRELAPGGYTANLLPGEDKWFAINGEWRRLDPLL